MDVDVVMDTRNGANNARSGSRANRGDRKRLGMPILVVGLSAMILAGGGSATAGSAMAGECFESLRQTLVGELPEFGDFYGYDVDLCGDVAIIGVRLDGDADTGSADILRFDGSMWTYEATLEPPESASKPGQEFGWAVALSGDTAFVGTNTDEVFVYRYDGSVWSFEATLTGEVDSGFGRAVDLDGPVAIVGAPFFGSDEGEVRLYRFDGTEWIEEACVLGGEVGVGFGGSVGIYGNRAVCGASMADSAAGAAFVLDFDGSMWTVTELSQSAPDTHTFFGSAVALSDTGTTILVGQPRVNNGRGAAWIYKYDGFGWVEWQRLVSDNRVVDEEFGDAVAVSDDLAIVGSPRRSSVRGVGFVFRRLEDQYEFSSRILPEVRDEGAAFAGSIALDGTTAILGAPVDDLAADFGGSAHVFDVPLCAEDLCREGTVDRLNGFADDVLFLNGSAGTAPQRIVEVGAGERIWIAMLSAPAGGPGKFLVHANLGEPNASTGSPLPASIGTACFEMLLGRGAVPIAVWNNIGKENLVGATLDFEGETIDPARTPSVFEDLSASNVESVLPPGTIVTLQGVLLDPGSLSPKAASATNAIVLSIL